VRGRGDGTSFGRSVRLRAARHDRRRRNVTNPHTWAVVEITDEKRGTRDAQYEGHSASHFYRAGYERGMVKVGDKIAVLIAPRKDGEDGGFIQAFTANGKTIGFGGLSPETGRRVEGASN
jgi:hypothetical protein